MSLQTLRVTKWAKTFLGIQKLQKEFSIHTTIYWYKFNDVKVKNRQNYLQGSHKHKVGKTLQKIFTTYCCVKENNWAALNTDIRNTNQFHGTRCTGWRIFGVQLVPFPVSSNQKGTFHSHPHLRRHGNYRACGSVGGACCDSGCECGGSERGCVGGSVRGSESRRGCW